MIILRHKLKGSDEMSDFRIGVIIDSFRVPVPQAVKKAAEVGAQGIQVYATSGEMAPENMTASKKSEFRKLVADNGLVISALCGDLGGGFTRPDANPARIEKSKRILDLAKELGTDIVTTHIGVVPEDENHERYKIMQEACFELSRYADEIGAHFAIETGPETSAVLKKFLDSLGYISYWKVLSGSEYGIPQDRCRVFVVSVINPKKEFVFPKTRKLTSSVEDYMLTKDELGQDFYQKLCMDKDIVGNYVKYNNHFLKFAIKQK